MRTRIYDLLPHVGKTAIVTGFKRKGFTEIIGTIEASHGSVTVLEYIDGKRNSASINNWTLQVAATKVFLVDETIYIHVK
jgi:hypothetical protein